MSPRRLPSVLIALAAAAWLGLSGCTVGEPPDAPDVPQDGAAGIERLLDEQGVSDSDIGFPRLAEDPASPDLGLTAPTQDQCDTIDPTDDLRVARVQHWWRSEPADGSQPVVISTELVLYQDGGAEAALQALSEAPGECPTRTTEDGTTITLMSAEVPRGAAPDAVAISSAITGPDLRTTSYVVAQRVDDLVGYVYVVGARRDATNQAARVTALVHARLEALAPQVEGTAT